MVYLYAALAIVLTAVIVFFGFGTVAAYSWDDSE